MVTTTEYSDKMEIKSLVSSLSFHVLQKYIYLLIIIQQIERVHSSFLYLVQQINMLVLQTIHEFVFLMKFKDRILVEVSHPWPASASRCS